MITYAKPKTRSTITKGTLVYFSADTKNRTVKCVVDESDGTTVVTRMTMEFNDVTDPSYLEFVQATGAVGFRNAIESFIATIPLTGGTIS